MATYNLAVPSTAVANICCSGTADGQIWGPADVYGCYLDDGDAGTFALVAFRFPIASAMAGTDVTSAILTLDRLPAAYGDSGTNGDAGLRCEASATPATFSASGTGRPYGRTWRTSQKDHTLPSGGDATTIDITPQIADLVATYDIANLTAIVVGVGALTIGWKASSLSYRAISNDGSGTLPQLTIITSSGTQVDRGCVCYSFSAQLGVPAPLVERATLAQINAVAVSRGASSVDKDALANTLTVVRGSQSSSTSKDAQFGANLHSASLAQGAAQTTGTVSSPAGTCALGAPARVEGKAAAVNLITTAPLRGSVGGGGSATVLVRSSTALPNGGGMQPIATFRDLNSNRHGFRDASSGGIGQLVHVCTPKSTTAGLYGYTSWSGDTWVPVALDTWDPFYYVKTSIQGSDGKLHLIYIDSNSGQIRYRRLTITHGNDGHINGATRDVEILIGSIGYLESTIDMRECVAQDGSHWIVFAKLAETNTTVQMGKWPIGAMSQTQVVGMNDSTSFTTIATGIVNQHDHGVQLAQFEGTRGIVCMWGYAIAELSLEPLKRVLLTPSGSTTWNVGSTVTESVANAAVGMMCSANGAIYRVASADNPGSCVYFDRYNSDGSLTANVFPSISMPTRNSFACLEVNADATKAFVIASDYSASLVIAHLESGAWVTNVGSVTDCYGFGGFGFGTGLCVLDQENLLTNGPIYTISVLEDPGAEPVLVGRAGLCNLATLLIASGAAFADRASTLATLTATSMRGAALVSCATTMPSGIVAVSGGASFVGGASYGLACLSMGAGAAVVAAGTSRSPSATWSCCAGAAGADAFVNSNVISSLMAGQISGADGGAICSTISGTTGSASVNVFASLDARAFSATSLTARQTSGATGAVLAQIITSAGITQSVGTVAQVTGYLPGGSIATAAGSAVAGGSAYVLSVSTTAVGGSNTAGFGVTAYVPSLSSALVTGESLVSRGPRLASATIVVEAASVEVSSEVSFPATSASVNRSSVSVEAAAYTYTGSYYRTTVPTTVIGAVTYRHRAGFIGVTIRDHK